MTKTPNGASFPFPTRNRPKSSLRMPSKRRPKKQPPPGRPPPAPPPQPPALPPPAPPDLWAASSTGSSSIWSAAEGDSSIPSCSSSCSANSEETRDLGWLFDAFPDVAHDRVDAVYRGAAGGDPSKAAELLALEKCTKPAAAAARVRRFGSAVACGMVSDVIGKGYLGNGGKKRNVEVGKDMTMAGGEVSSEDGEQFLCSVLGEETELGMAVVKDVLGQCGGNIENALNALLGLLDSTSDHDMGRNLDSSKSDPTPLSVDAPSAGALSHHLPKQEFYVPTCSSEYETENGLASCGLPPSQMKSGVANPEIQQNVLESLFGMPARIKDRQPCSMSWKKIVELGPFGRASEFSSLSISDNNANDNHGNKDGYTEFRTVASQQYGMMKTYYQKASSAFLSGQHSYASYLAEKGKAHCEIAQRADEKASQEIFEARNKSITNTITIDLHGQHVMQAMRLLKYFLICCLGLPSVHLKVITGCGNGGGTGRGKIKQAAIDFAKREGIEYGTENEGTIVLYLHGRREYSFLNDEDDCDEE